MKAIRFVIPLLLTLCAALPLRAQQGTIDSLQRVIRTHAERDTTHIRALVSLSEQYMARDPVRARGCLDRALLLAERSGFRRGVAMASLGLAKYHIDRGAADSAAPLVERGLAIYQALQWGWGIANAHNFRGMVHGLRGEHWKAIAEFRCAGSLYEQVGRKERAADVLGNIGVQFHDRGMCDSAVAYFTRALGLFHALGKRSGEAMMYMNLANAQANVHKALEYYMKSLELFEETGDRYWTFKARYNTGMTLTGTEQKEAARCMLEKVVDEAESYRDDETLAGALAGLSALYRRQGDAARAMDCIQRGLVHLRTSGPSRLTAMMHNNLARILLDAGDIAQARNHGAAALEAARGVAARRGIQDALLLLAEISERGGDLAAALAHYRAAYAMRDSILSDEGVRRIDELNARYEADRRENDIRMLETGRALQAAVLDRQHLEILQRSQRIALLDRQHAIDLLESDRMQSELTLQKEISVRHQRDASLLAKDKQLQSSVLSRATLARNAAIAAIGGLFVIGFLIQRRVRESRRAAELRAEATDAKARLAEARAAALEAEKERREKEAQRELTRRLIEAQERTHRRIAGDLHDGLGQGLLVVKNGAYMALQSPALPEDARENLEAVSEAADVSLAELRQVVRDLRPTQLDRFGLRETLRSMLQQLNDTTGVRFTGSIDEIDSAFAEGDDINAYRIVQEAANNIVKHARASEASVHIARADDEVYVEIADDGCGFNVSSTATGAGASQGFGLQSIAERARILGGSMTIDSAPGKGTRLRVRVPVRRGSAAQMGRAAASVPD